MFVGPIGENLYLSCRPGGMLFRSRGRIHSARPREKRTDHYADPSPLVKGDADRRRFGILTRQIAWRFDVEMADPGAARGRSAAGGRAVYAARCFQRWPRACVEAAPTQN